MSVCSGDICPNCARLRAELEKAARVALIGSEFAANSLAVIGEMREALRAYRALADACDKWERGEYGYAEVIGFLTTARAADTREGEK